MKSSEFQRWLEKQGVTILSGKDSHLHLELDGRKSILPMHSKDPGKGLVAIIKKQLGLK